MAVLEARGVDPRRFHCPAAAEGPGYAFNSQLDGLSLADLAAPETVVLLFESHAGAPYAADPLTGHAPRHQDGGFVLFADGRAEWRREPPPAAAGLRAVAPNW